MISTYNLILSGLPLDDLFTSLALPLILADVVDVLYVDAVFQLRHSPTDVLYSLESTRHIGSLINRGFCLRNFAQVPLMLVFVEVSTVLFITLTDRLSLFVSFEEVLASVSIPPTFALLLLQSLFSSMELLKCTDLDGLSGVTATLEEGPSPMCFDGLWSWLVIFYFIQKLSLHNLEI